MQPDEDKTLNRLIEWANGRQDVRALVLTSTRTVPGGTVDRLSDYDVIMAVSDKPGIAPFFKSRDWLEAFGHVLVLYRDPIQSWFARHAASSGQERLADDDFMDESFAYITQYDQDGLKIDFTVMPASLLRRIAPPTMNVELVPVARPPQAPGSTAGTGNHRAAAARGAGRPAAALGAAHAGAAGPSGGHRFAAAGRRSPSQVARYR